jgi:uncharacterized protein (DUF433 family)
MTQLTHALFTIPEAAFIAGLTAKDINREIDAHIIDAGAVSERRLKGSDLFYLLAVKDVRDQLGPSLRRNIRAAIDAAVTAARPEATVHRFVFSIDRLRADLLGPFEALERSKHDQIESRPDVLGGEPVLKGTRVAARHVADLLKEGATRAEIADDFDLDETQIEAAVVFDQTSPKRGRPIRRPRTPAYVPPT